jgi:O-methyltransferase
VNPRRRLRTFLYRRNLVVQRPPFPIDAGALERTGRYYPVDFPAPWIETIERVLPYTQTTVERLGALCAAVEHVVAHRIPGAVVECGVWRGGSMMAAALTLLRRDAASRDLYLFDTFTGMTPPGERDVDFAGRTMYPGDHGVPAGEVRGALRDTGYDMDRVHLVEGRVEDTLPAQAPGEIALLRLDTDWYESTRHELEHLYPRLAPGGILILDDYGHFKGARQAVDEYFAGQPVFLSRIDYAGRLLVKAGGPVP